MPSSLAQCEALTSSNPDWPSALVAALSPPASPRCAPPPAAGLLREADVSEVVPRVLLASSLVGLDAPRLRSLAVHTLVNVVSADEQAPLDDEGLATSGIEACCCLNMDGAWRPGYERRIRSAADALAEAVGEGRVGLVHGGPTSASRAAAVVLCYLMLHHRAAAAGGSTGGGADSGEAAAGVPLAAAGVPLADALVLLRAAWPHAWPRRAYLRWLHELDVEQRGVPSVPLAMLELAEEPEEVGGGEVARVGGAGQ